MGSSSFERPSAGACGMPMYCRTSPAKRAVKDHWSLSIVYGMMMVATPVLAAVPLCVYFT